MAARDCQLRDVAAALPLLEPLPHLLSTMDLVRQAILRGRVRTASQVSASLAPLRQALRATQACAILTDLLQLGTEAIVPAAVSYTHLTLPTIYSV